MRLDFNVLWVDDQPDRIKAQIKGITRRMEEEGFHFNPTTCKSIAEVRDRLGDDTFTDEIDLILVDWDLGGQLKGQNAIAEIRETVPYKDVVFYSAHEAADKLRELAFEKGAEGVYCARRGDLVDEVVGVFESLVKKVLDLDHTRGIVMGATCDIDHMVSECLMAMHEGCDPSRQQALLDKARRYGAKQVARSEEALARLTAAQTMQELLKEHLIFTAYARLGTLASALKYEEFQDQKGYRKAVTTYQQRAVKARNMLGHEVLVPSGKPGTATDGEGNPVTLKEMRELRRLILNLRGEFRSLMTTVVGEARPNAPLGGALARGSK